MPETHQPTNRLIHETSPYLLQHAHNPVDWYPWGEEAFQKAKQEDKPILLSCGYSACHWCHVMERECFENPDIAALMNSYFVNIKVDREERPDIDQLYQQAVQALSGQGGWPLTVFMDHVGQPFFGGTYFPPSSAYGRSGFPKVLQALHREWTEQRDQVAQAGEELRKFLESGERKPALKSAEPSSDTVRTALGKALNYFDREHGGFDHAPKFPNPTLVHLLFSAGTTHREREAVEAAHFTLSRMARGGIYDQLGGGFHRYSTDRYWLVPHFEKMLYDNAQLIKLYAIGYQLRPEETYQRIVRETTDYLRREMTDPDGGFYATEDADSDGEEGKYYVWTKKEVREALSAAEADAVVTCFGMTDNGNFEGKNILNRLGQGGENHTEPEIIKQAKEKLLALREQRVKPFRDQKIITGWNGLAISGLAYAYQVFGREEDYRSARRAAEFILHRSMLAGGELARIYKEEARVRGMLDDYAFLAQAMIDLYEADFQPEWLEAGLRLVLETVKRFGEGSGYYYLAGACGGQLLTRPLSRYDQAIPSGVSVHAGNLLRLAAFTGQFELRQEAERIFKAYAGQFSFEVWGYAGFLTQLDLYQRGSREFVFVSRDYPPELLRKLQQKYIPGRILVWADPETSKHNMHPARELLQGRGLIGEKPACYTCLGESCLPPVTEWEDLKRQFEVETESGQE